MPRIKSRNILPTVVKSRNLETIIFGSNIGSAQTALNSGEQVFIRFTATHDDGYEILGANYLALYIGSIAITNLLPGGASIDESQWQVIGPFYDWDQWTDSGYAKHIDYVSLYVRNISAGAQTVIIRNTFKYFSPRENAS